MFPEAPQIPSVECNGASSPVAGPSEIEHASLVAAVEQSADSIVITDTTGAIQYVNPAFEAITGYTRAEAIGQNPRILKSGCQSAAVYEELWAKLTAGLVWRGDLVNRRKDGSFYREEVMISPVRDSAGNVTRYIAIKHDVTERRAEQEAKRLLASIVESSSDAIATTTLDTTITSWNRSAETLLGYSAEEIIGRKFALLVPDEYFEPFALAVGKVQAGLVSQYNTVRRSKDGHLIDVAVTVSPLRNTAGEIAGASVVLHDIRLRVHAERSLRASEQRFRGAFDEAPCGICLVHLDGKLLQVNPSFCRLTGYPERELLAATWLQLIHPEELATALQTRKQALSGNSPCVEVQTRFIDKLGHQVWVQVRLSLVRDTSGTPLYFVAHVEDIGERKRAEEALRESEERFRTMADGCPALMWVTDAAGEIQFVNRTLREFGGLTGSRIEGSGWHLEVHPDDVVRAGETFKRGTQERKPYSMEARVRRLDGEWRWLACYAEPRFSSDGEFLGHVGLAPDVTERKQAEEAILRSEERFRQLAENIHQIFWMMDITGKELLYVSPAYEQIWGRSCESRYRQPLSWLESVVPEDRDQVASSLSRQQGGQFVQKEYRIQTPDGQRRWISDRSFPVCDSTGRMIRLAGIAEDITERKRYELELVQARRAAESANQLKSRFLANMSHEIRTPMNGVLGMLQLLCDTDLTAEQREYASIIESSGHALLTLIDGILDLSKIEAQKLILDRTDFDAQSIVYDIVQALRAQAKGRPLAIRSEGPSQLPLLRGDPNRLRQVLLNLASNAVKFTEQGEVSLTTEIISREASCITLRFSIKDTGIGIDPRQSSALFSPFVQADTSSTRKYGGVGLGLTISKELVELMGGTIGFASRVGEGSTFWFTAVFELPVPILPVPALENAHPEAKQLVTAGTRPRSEARILVAEDNHVNQLVVLAQLARLGYQGQVVPNGAAAIQALEKEEYDLVLMDCQMPGIDGIEATESIRRSARQNRTPPIIAITAHAMAGDRERCLSQGMNDYLSKPLGIKQLEAALVKWLPEFSTQ